MKRITTLLLLLCPLLACANGGAWTQKSAGGSVSVGNQILKGALLQPPFPLPPSAQAHHMTWRIELLSPPPPGLQIKLCSPTKCLPLEGLSGQRVIDFGLSAVGPFRFIYAVNSRGALLPALNVVSNQITINYHTDKNSK